MQKVSLGITKSGQHGLFTNRMLAYPLTKEQYDWLHTVDFGTAAAWCKARRFQLVH